MNKSKDKSQRHSNIVYFQNPEMDFYLQGVALGYAHYGGASIGEVFHAASRIDEKDTESWIQEWIALGKVANAHADDAISKGHDVTARNQYLHAFTYFRLASFCLRASDQRFYETSQKLRTCFRAAARLFTPPIELVALAFEGNTLPGYFIRAAGKNERRKTLIIIGGGETYCEDLYFLGGAEAAQHGYNVLLITMPGQGTTPFDGLYHQSDVEIPMAIALDYLYSRPDVDTEYIGVLGWSLGGYIVLRTASFEERIKACAAGTPIVDFHQFAVDGLPPALKHVPGFIGDSFIKLAKLMDPSQLTAIEKFMWQLGVTKLSEGLDKFKDWQVDVSQITCPVLCMLGEGEDEAFRTQTYACYEALTGRKELRIFSVEQGADAHCQANNIELAVSVVCDWMDEVFQIQN